MANNRLWLKCQACDEEKLLAKYDGTSWCPCGTEWGWADWYEEHVPCGPVPFVLEYENPEYPA